MVFQRITFTRLFQPSGKCFGFETEGKRYFDVVAPGRSKIEEGMTVIALLKSSNSFGGDSLLGWINCHDGSIACDSALGHIAWFVASTYFAVMFPLRAYTIIASPLVADWIALLVAGMFGVFALISLYSAAVSFLVKRELVNVRDFSSLNPPPAA